VQSFFSFFSHYMLSMMLMRGVDLLTETHFLSSVCVVGSPTAHSVSDAV